MTDDVREFLEKLLEFRDADYVPNSLFERADGLLQAATRDTSGADAELAALRDLKIAVIARRDASDLGRVAQYLLEENVGEALDKLKVIDAAIAASAEGRWK